MKKILLISLLFCFTLPVFATVESRPTIDIRHPSGLRVRQYGEREDYEFSDKKYKYKQTTIGSKIFYERKALLLYHPCRDIQANGKIYEIPGCKQKPKSETWSPVIGWSAEDYGTIVEYNVQFVIDVLRLNVYALDKNGNVTKYKIVTNKQKNKIKQILLGDFETYEPVSYFVQTKVGEKPKYQQGFKYDKNGRMLPMEKQNIFSEIVEYDMQGNILSIYRKNEYDRINEFLPDGKTLKTYHDTTYIPYLQWAENEEKAIFATIDEFTPMLFDR